MSVTHSDAELLNPPSDLPRGFRDLAPAHTYLREELIHKAIAVCRKYGLLPLSTSSVEFLSVLKRSGSEETRKQIFIVDGPEHEPAGLRYELTVSLARYIAQSHDVVLPFRRYQIGMVWRGDKPGAGRFREFIQFDFDFVGTSSGLADVEIIALQSELCAAMGIEAVEIHLSSRGVLDCVLDYAGIARELGPSVFRVLDKRDKVGIGNVKLELGEGYTGPSGAYIPGLHLTPRQITRLQVFLGISGNVRADVIAQMRDVLHRVHGASAAIDSLEHISKSLAERGLGDEQVIIDVSLVRGLEYYTGAIFEAVVRDARGFGSIGGGGRYDSLMRKLGGPDVPAVGASIGIDRVVALLDHQKKIGPRMATADVLVLNFDPLLTSECLRITDDLRRAGIATELYMGAEYAPGRQLKYADRLGVPLAILYGSDEHAAGVVTLKKLGAGRELSATAEGREEWLAFRPGQVTVRRENLVASVTHAIREAGPRR